jgi:prephenate dehydrogenase
MPLRRSSATAGARPSRTSSKKSVAVIGTGLIGASIGLAARASGFNVIGWDVQAGALRRANARGAIDSAATSLSAAVESSQIVVLAAPLDAVLFHLPVVFRHARWGALIVDVAGVKGPVAARAARLLAKKRDVQFVAGHPIAGSERSGASAAEVDLLGGRAFALYAPPQKDRTHAYAAAARFVKRLGAVPVRVTPHDHDEAVAALSALPQLASIALALASAESGARRAPHLAGSGYRDATRLALSRFAVWKPGLSANLKNVRKAIHALIKRVKVIEGTLRRRDWPALERLFLAAARERRRVNPL